MFPRFPHRITIHALNLSRKPVAMSKKPSQPLDRLQPQRICLIKPSALGDVVQTLPTLAGLRARWPQAHITWVVNRPLSPLLESVEELDATIPFDRHLPAGKRAGSLLRLWRELRGNRFDLVIDLQGLLRSGLMTWATGAATRLGMSNAREGAAKAYTHAVDVPRDMPAVARYWMLAQALGCDGDPPSLCPKPSTDDWSWAREQLNELPRPWLAIHPGAQWETKRWGGERFAQVARRAYEQYGGGTIILGGPDEVELCGEFERELKTLSRGGPSTPMINVAGRTSLLRLAAVSGTADVFLSGDTGPMHLAASMGTPTVAVFTCTSPLRAGPHGTGHRIVATCVSCAASYLKTCPTMHCRDEITPERVWAALDATLSPMFPSRTRHAG